MNYPVTYFHDREMVAFSRFGKIHLSSGLYKRLTPDQLRSVIAHETGHLARDHWMDKLGIDAGFLALGVLALWPGFALSLPVQLALLWAALFSWYFCRRQVNHWCEYDADAYAVRQGYGASLATALCVVTWDHQLATFDHPAARDRVSRIYEKI